jgi:hypothetical protein
MKSQITKVSSLRSGHEFHGKYSRVSKNIFFAWLVFIGFAGYGQVVINELDSDTPSTDELEFVELKSTAPNFSLNGYVLVFFNGTGTNATKSYYAISLNGLTTDVNGIAVVGNTLVSPVPDRIFSNSIIQNGPDGVALYLGTTADFPMNTTASATNLVDALVYDTSDADATALMALWGEALQIDENANSLQTTQSIQRKNDGTYEVKAPTPGANNDGSGFIYNGVKINVAANTYNEGDSFDITFTTQTDVTSNLAFTFTMTSGSFNASDYSGNLNVLIPNGTHTFTTTIILTDDANDDGDELGIIKLGSLPAAFNRLNDNVEIRVIDNDFTTLPWGTPLNPTYGLVASTAPVGYYASLEGKSGAALKQAIQDIIANPAVVHAHNYGDIQYILNDADQNPLNSNQVWLMYVEQGRAKYKFQTTASNVGSWNREHIFPQSRGGFADGTDSTPDGINVWLPTNANDILAGHGDAHHIRAEDGPENTTRSNRDYGSDYNGPAGSQGSWHGDVARALFYMAVRYNGLNLVNGNPSDAIVGQMGDLASLLTWNHSDPKDDFEMHRNNVIYTWQVNRNPFIDYPDLADYIWGTHAGETWFSSLAVGEVSGLNVGIWPNPANNAINISGIDADATIEIYNISGAKLLTSVFHGDTRFDLGLASGLYFAKISSEGKTAVKKIIIQ